MRGECAKGIVVSPRAEERLEGPQHEVQMLNRGEEGTDSEE